MKIPGCAGATLPGPQNETEENKPMKVLVINCGSSSLKYQLLDMETEKVLCKGLCERIGGEGSCITHQVGGNKMKADAPFLSHRSVCQAG